MFITIKMTLSRTWSARLTRKSVFGRNSECQNAENEFQVHWQQISLALYIWWGTLLEFVSHDRRTDQTQSIFNYYLIIEHEQLERTHYHQTYCLRLFFINEHKLYSTFCVITALKFLLFGQWWYFDGRRASLALAIFAFYWDELTITLPRWGKVGWSAGYDTQAQTWLFYPIHDWLGRWIPAFDSRYFLW